MTYSSGVVDGIWWAQVSVRFVVRVRIFFFQAEDGIRDKLVTGVQTCALPIWWRRRRVAHGRVPSRWAGAQGSRTLSLPGCGPGALGSAPHVRRFHRRVDERRTLDRKSVV